MTTDHPASADAADTDAGTGPPGLDLGRLRTHLDAERPGLAAAPLTGRLIEGGKSNLTYAVTDGASRWVVRRPPLGHVLATAHDMRREFTVLRALHPTAVPVPEPLLLCEDDAVLGAPFYVMEHVDGVPYRTAAQLARLGEDRTRRIVLELVDTLVALHSVDPEAAGLGDFGRPDGFLERQVRRWGKQLAASRSRDLPGIDELHERLGAALPASGPAAVVHGDYKLDNVLVGDGDAITAVLDWEMSTLGDPLTDLGLLLMYSGQQDPDSPVAALGGAPGYPSTDELTARYAQGSGRDVSSIAWYTAFANFKLAVIAEGIHYRYTLGQTVGAGFDRIGSLVPRLIEQGLTTLQEG
ncbi:phosphotransferase family protein [Streptantibioticus parmotrematis]|uniref:phosphotransferase family protein n=1 Tax=Streptantibioticus parmotrematis TaxID=2873249 RepID=UPI003F4D61FE